MTPIEKEQAWTDGHLSEVSVVLIADGAIDLVAKDVHAHLDSCASCSNRVADALTLSMRTDVLMRAAGVPQRTHQFPAWLVAAALALATIGFLPSAGVTVHSVMRTITQAPLLLPLVVDSAYALASALSSSTFTVAALASATVLAIVGFAVARQARRPQLT